MKNDGSRYPNKKRKRIRLYNMIADKIGIIPNVRPEDNQYQFELVLAITVIAVLCGYIFFGLYGAFGFLFIGILLGGIISGFILMIKGLKR